MHCWSAGTHSEVIRAIWCSLVRIASQYEVIRAILFEGSPCCGGHTVDVDVAVAVHVDDAGRVHALRPEDRLDHRLLRASVVAPKDLPVGETVILLTLSLHPYWETC